MLSTYTWILLCCASALLIVYVFITQVLRIRRKGEPPIVKGSLLWGSAQDFSTNAISFLHSCHKKYGDVFSIRLINQYLTVIMDPHSYEAMSREKNFDFDPIQKQVNWNVFSFVLKEPRKMIKDTGRTVRGAYMESGMQSYINNLDSAYEHLPQEISQSGYTDTGLRDFCARTIFSGLFNTIFGNDSNPGAFNAYQVYKNFEVFHKYFNFFWLGMPKCLFSPAMKALGELLQQPLSSEMIDRSDCSDYIKTAINYMKEQGQTEAEVKGHNLVYLHVNYNTFRLAFWVLSNLLNDEKAMAALMDELNQAIEDRKDDETNTATFTLEDVESMKVLDSVVQESARLSSGVFMVRYIQEDTQFKTDSGESFLMRKGDRVALYPPAIHKDPEIFEEPMEFKHDRFVDAKFYKNGKQLKHPVMAFGSLCPGKRYALLQLKWYVMTVLNQYNMSLHDGELAEYDYEYHGHEILPPVKDVKFKYAQKDNVCHLAFAKE